MTAGIVAPVWVTVCVVAGVLVVAGLARAAVLAGWHQEVAGRSSLREHPRLAWAGLAVAALEARVRGRWEARPRVRRRRLAAGLPGVLDDAARALRAGASLRQAIADAGASAAGPAAALMASLASRVEMGVPLVVALDQLARDEPSGEVRLVAAALHVAAEAGGRAATAVEAVAATLRERHAAAQEVAAHSVQARLSAVVIALLPVAFTVWCVATDDRAAAFLLASRAGWLCLVSGLGLLGTGAWWMARIVGSAP